MATGRPDWGIARQARYADWVQATATAGNNVLTLAGPPAGVIRHITHAEAHRDTGATANLYRVVAVISGKQHILTYLDSPAVGRPTLFDGEVTLAEGDYLEAWLDNLAAGSLLRLGAIGWDEGPSA